MQSVHEKAMSKSRNERNFGILLQGECAPWDLAMESLGQFAWLRNGDAHVHARLCGREATVGARLGEIGWRRKRKCRCAQTRRGSEQCCQALWMSVVETIPSDHMLLVQRLEMAEAAVA